MRTSIINEIAREINNEKKLVTWNNDILWQIYNKINKGMNVDKVVLLYYIASHVSYCIARLQKSVEMI